MSRRSFELNGEKYIETDFINYFVTNCGKVAKIKFQDDGELKSYLLISQEITKSGHRRIEINGKHPLVHRMVYQIYGKEILDSNLVIDHIDANPSNNHISNLRQVTQRENINNAILHGNFGRNGNTKIRVFDSEFGTHKDYDCVKEFLIDIGAPNYMIKHGALSSIYKRKEFHKYTYTKIGEI